MKQLELQQTNRTLSVLTASGTSQPCPTPVGATLLHSNGTDTTKIF